MAKRVAVITDATSSGYLFPYWQRYYGGLFGEANLHVVTYAGLGPAFAGLPIGSVEELTYLYDDGLRAPHIAARVTDLLRTHDVVLRCDVDEFLIADPRLHASLAAYVEGLALPFVTARGVDLVEMEGDSPLMLDGRPLLYQRQWGVRTSSLCKTALTTVPLIWGPGFHSASVRPAFDDLFLVHTKFADVKGRVAWFKAMLAQVRLGSSEAKYYSDGRVKLEGFNGFLRTFERSSETYVLDSTTFDEKFLTTVNRNPINGIYQGEFIVEQMLRRCSFQEI